ncbi:MAG: 4Fe-4S binding protein [Desulfovibrionaceae bacterium]|nr:4Fe-4S binding protein [Desulfovibrionaceae bacterium]
MSTKTHVIDERRCKSCGLCVEACPKKVLGIGTEINGQGYNYVERVHPEKCIRCDFCGIVCPDVAIGVVVTP